ncbi:MAG: AAA family ATPase [Pirellulaceae bacterium]|nr:AAA family ATPase [Pirellulaceae bacterium]
MITGISIENFKGIREPVKLDFRPITLHFGANSSGKSTVLHALHYAREVFERHNLDADQTIAGGKYIDLGEFRRLVHREDDNAIAAPEMPIRFGRPNGRHRMEAVASKQPRYVVSPNCSGKRKWKINTDHHFAGPMTVLSNTES